MPTNAPEPDATLVTGGVRPLTAAELDAALNAPAVPGYDVLGKLGEGGMGVVYRARQAGLNRDVALKLVLPGGREPGRWLPRFRAEAEAVAAVRHPHVVQVYATGEDHGRAFLALEYLPGGSLADRLLETGPLPPVVAALLVEKLALGVQAAHDIGIVHRDLKPANVLFDAAGEPKITDFGLAKRTSADVTATHAVIGTPSYMAPEQARGQAKFVGPAADVWALGVVLYECLTGRRPFPGDSAEVVLHRLAYHDPAPPRAVAPDVPRDLELICLKCLEKPPHERYPTAADLAADLGRFAAGGPVSVRPPGIVERLAKWVRRDPTRAAAYGLTAAVCLLVALSTAAVRLWQESEDARDEAVAARDTLATEKRATEDARDRLAAEKKATEAVRDRLAGETLLLAEESRRLDEARGRATAAADRAARFEYARTVEVAQRDWEAGNFSLARAYLAASKPALRGWEWRYVHRLVHAEQLVLGAAGARLTAAVVSGDGRLLAAAGGDGTARVWDAATGAAVATLGKPGPALLAVAFSGDGTLLAAGGDGGVARVWDVATGAEQCVVRGPGAVATVAFSPDGKRLLTAGSDPSARVWDAATGAAVLAVGKRVSGTALAAAYSPDGKLIATANTDGTVCLCRADTGSEAAIFRGHLVATAVAFSPDGARVASAGIEGTVRVWDAATERPLAVLRALPTPHHSVAFGPGGAWVATAGADGAARLWDAATGRELRAVRADRRKLASVAAAGDGGRLVTVADDGLARVWDLAAPPPEVELATRDKGVTFLAASPAVDRALVATAAGGVVVRDARTGADGAKLGVPGGRVTAAAFCGDGTRVAVALDDGTAAVWDAATGAAAARLAGAGVLSAVAFDADGKRLLGGGRDGSARVWDAATGAVVTDLPGHAAAVTAVAFGPGGRLLTAGADDAVRVRGGDGRDGPVIRGGADGFASAAVSPDGSTVATGSAAGVLRLWDAKTGDARGTLGEGLPLGTTVAFSPDGGRVAAGGPAGWVGLWDVASGANVFAREAAADPVDVVAFSPDGMKLVAGARAGRVVLWDATPAGGK